MDAATLKSKRGCAGEEDGAEGKCLAGFVVSRSCLLVSHEFHTNRLHELHQRVPEG